MTKPALYLVTDEPHGDEVPASREQSLQWLHWLLRKLDGLDEDAPENADPGACDDCGRETIVRFVLGRLHLCRLCFTARQRAAKRVAA
jgi:ribosomal protein S14